MPRGRPKKAITGLIQPGDDANGVMKAPSVEEQEQIKVRGRRSPLKVSYVPAHIFKDGKEYIKIYEKKDYGDVIKQRLVIQVKRSDKRWVKVTGNMEVTQIEKFTGIKLAEVM